MAISRRNSFARLVTYKQLRAFAQLIRSGSISAAADDLNVTAPAITQQLRNLEDLAGLPLFERTPAGPKPTAAGQEVLNAISQIELALGACSDALASLSGLQGGSINVGVVSTAKYFAPFALAAFRKKHPNVEISLLIGNREETIAALREFALDVCIMGRPPHGFDVERVLIGDHPHVIIAPTDHPLLAAGTLSLTTLAEETFLMRERGSGTRQLLEDLLKSVGLAPKIGMEIGSNETIKQAVMAGLGVALISAHTIAAELADHRLAVLPVEGLPIVRKWYAVKRAEKRLLPAAAALWAFLSSEGAGFLPPVPLDPA